jgi:hypothetical protein
MPPGQFPGLGEVLQIPSQSSPGIHQHFFQFGVHTQERSRATLTSAEDASLKEFLSVSSLTLVPSFTLSAEATFFNLNRYSTESVAPLTLPMPTLESKRVTAPLRCAGNDDDPAVWAQDVEPESPSASAATATPHQRDSPFVRMTFLLFKSFSSPEVWCLVFTLPLNTLVASERKTIRSP